MADTPHILMCPPDYFGIEYEINPWMNTTRQTDHAEAIRQWRGLHALLSDAGATISLLDPVPQLPDLVFTANAALIHQQRAIVSRFRHPQRQGEQAHNEAWFTAHGFHVERLPDAIYFEGAGDALYCGDTLVAGYRIRSDARGHQQVAAMVGSRVLPVELIDPYYYHIDTCFCPLEPDMALWYPPAFDEYGQRAIIDAVKELIAVEPDEATHFACNAVVVGRTVVTNTGCPRLQSELKRRGYTARETPLGEFVKAGGSAKCLTLRLDGEEAAAWKK